MRLALVELISTSKSKLPTLGEVKVYLWRSLGDFTSNPAYAGIVTAAIIGGLAAFIAYSVFGISVLATAGIAAVAGGSAGTVGYHSAPKIHPYAVVGIHKQLTTN